MEKKLNNGDLLKHTYQLDVVFSCDENYVMPAGVMLCSLFENNQDALIRVHGLYRGKGDFLAPLQTLCERYGGSFIPYEMSKIELPSLPVYQKSQRADITVSAYYRLFVAEVLPADLDKVLYLDCDIVVESSIKDLWEVNLDGYPLGAVPDNQNSNVHLTNRLGYNVNDGYFNSGVLLINLNYWREHNVLKSFKDYIAENYYNLQHHDQDVLNHEFHGLKMELPIRYNFLTSLMYKEKYIHVSCSYFDQISEAYVHPCIIHYCGTDRPWYSNSTHPMKAYWYKYQNLTEWKGQNWGRKKERLMNRLKHFACILLRKESKWGKMIYKTDFIE